MMLWRSLAPATLASVLERLRPPAERQKSAKADDRPRRAGAQPVEPQAPAQ